MSPTNILMKFGMKGKLNQYFIRRFEILGNCGKVSYRLAFPFILSMVHPVFHVSMLKQYHHDDSHVIQWDSGCLDQNMFFEGELSSKP